MPSVDHADHLVGGPIEIVVSYATPIEQPKDTFGLEQLQKSGTSEWVDSVAMSLNAPNVSHFVVTFQPQAPPADDLQVDGRSRADD